MIARVAISRRLLNEGEHVVVSTRTHVKALLLPALWLILVAARRRLRLDRSRAARPRSRCWCAVIWLLALVVVVWLVVAPFLRWLTTSYTVTDRRLITRTGVLSRRGHDIPLTRISDVAYEHGLVDRMLGCGTLVVSDASEQGRVRLPRHPAGRAGAPARSATCSHGPHRRPDRRERRPDDGT